MVVNLLHAGHVLRGYYGGLPRTLLGDDATEVDDAVANDNVEAERAPIVVLDRGNDAAANVVVVGRWIRNVSGEARNGLQQIGACDDPGEFAVLRNDAEDALTGTEARIAALVAGGRSNREVAADLFISVSTVEAHLTRIYRKLGLRGRTELTAWYGATH